MAKFSSDLFEKFVENVQPARLMSSVVLSGVANEL
ncbi:MAG: hypothetical protein GY820_21510 [Gammaproteobacteria bacterium]|nr:hypothetical protein [Gammaproteobacteria bacterium]